MVHLTKVLEYLFKVLFKCVYFPLDYCIHKNLQFGIVIWYILWKQNIIITDLCVCLLSERTNTFPIVKVKFCIKKESD